jgi:hypothetical protein
MKEVQLVTSQIDILSEKEPGTKKIKTEVPTCDFETPPNVYPAKKQVLF